MSIDEKTVAKIATLARIKLDDKEAAGYAGELDQIMNWIEQLQEVDTEGVEPLTSVVDMELFKRADKVNDGGYQDKILANAPETTEGYFVVPKVVE